jgi:hypothetical protein
LFLNVAATKPVVATTIAIWAFAAGLLIGVFLFS